MDTKVDYTRGKDYWITVGSINEPVFVDDKGAEAFISLADPSDSLNSDANGTKNVEGLEKTIKVQKKQTRTQENTRIVGIIEN